MLPKDEIGPSDPLTISRADFLQAFENAKQCAGLLRKKYPTLKAYLVLTSGGNFTPDPTQDIEVMMKFPGLVPDDATRTAVEKQKQQIKDLPRDAGTFLMAQYRRARELQQKKREQLKNQIDLLRADKNLSSPHEQTEPQPNQPSKPVLNRATNIAIHQLQTELKALSSPAMPDEETIQRMQRKLDRQLKEMERHLVLLVANLAFRTTPLFELRFDHLDYEAIWRLQQDEAIDRKRTPQTRASIRIVLGSVADFLAS